MTKTQYLEDHRDEIIAKYLDGENTCELGKAYGCSNALVWLRLQHWGVEIRPTKVTDRFFDRILELHHEGFVPDKIGAKLGIGSSTVGRALKKAGIDISHRSSQRDDPLVNHKEEIISRYVAGEGSQSIGNSFDCADRSILSSLKRWGVARRGIRDYSYPVNESFFDVIDTEVKAYVLGFWMADGCNMSDVPSCRLSITDRDILLDIAAAMGWGGPIGEVQPRKPTHKMQFALKIGSRHMSDALTRLGCVKRKTYLAEFPTAEQVPVHLQSHLLRGWVDGDGSIYCSCHQGRVFWATTLTGTEAVCRGASECVGSHLGFRGSMSVAHAGEKHTTWSFVISGHRQLKTYLDWLYHDATIFLRRKFDKYQEFLASLPKSAAADSLRN